MDYVEGFPKTINEQIAEYTNTEKQIFTLKDANNSTILDGDKVLEYLEVTYNCYKTQYWLHTLWTTYDAIHRNDFLKAYEAVTAVYNPIENYNGTETTVRQRMDGETTETITHGKSTTNSIDAGGIVNTTQVTSADDDTLRNDTQTTQTGSTTNAESGTTETVTDTTTKSLTIGDTTYTADYVEGETRDRHGNLGVTSSQNMITQEIELRLKPLIMLYLDQFANTYFYYIGGDWCDYRFL